VLDKAVLSELIRVKTSLKSDELDKLAKIVFTAYTQNGLPPDFAFDAIAKRRPLTKDEKLYILAGYQDLDMEHKHKSGITPKRQEALQKRNRDTIASFLKTGEVGIF
jgi:hypothetical protein